MLPAIQLAAVAMFTITRPSTTLYRAAKAWRAVRSFASSYTPNAKALNTSRIDVRFGPGLKESMSSNHSQALLVFVSVGLELDVRGRP